MKKHITCLILASIILSSVSCGSDSPEVTRATEQTAAPDSTAEPSRLDELAENDFGGEEFIILDANYAPTLNQNIPLEELAGDVINDKITERNAAVQELLNVTFVYEQRLEGGAALFKNSILAGDRSYDIIFSPIGGAIAPFAADGLLADLCSLDALSLDKEWWSPYFYENLRVNGRMYYTSGDISPAIYCTPACYFVNQKLAQNYKIDTESLYAAVESGAWTLDKLWQTAGDIHDDLNADDKMNAADDFFGILIGRSTMDTSAFTAASGVKFAEISPSGDLTCDLASERNFAVIEKLRSTIASVSVSIPEGDQLFETFKNDRAIFMSHFVSSAYTRFRDMSSDFLILPLPKYDESQPSYYSYVNCWANAFTALPVNGQNDRAAVIMETLAFLSLRDLRPSVVDVAFKNKGARNEKDAGMLDIIFDSIYLDLGAIQNFGGELELINQTIHAKKDLASGWAKIKPKAEKAIADFCEKW